MATAYICPMCIFNCDNLPDLERHLEAHENNAILSPVKQQQSTAPVKSARNSPLYAKSQALLNLQQHVSPKSNGLSTIVRSSPGKTYDRRYSCKMCPFSTHSAKAYFNHRQMAHDEQLLVTECPFCDYASQYPGKVKKHLTDEHPLQQMAIVKSPVQSKNHRVSENTTVNGKFSMETPRFTDCPFCSFTSMDPEAFREHVLVNHLSDKNFRCLVCNRLYRYRGDCSFHIRKKHPECMVAENIDSLREYISEFQPTSMSSAELKELLSCPLTPSLASAPANAPPTIPRQQQSFAALQRQQPNPPHAFRCGYCKFSSVNSGDVKKHQTWKHAHFASHILPIDPNDPQQQPIVSCKRKRGQSGKMIDDDGRLVQRPRTSMPSQRQLTVDTSPPTMVRTSNSNNDGSTSTDLLSPNEVPSSSFECDQCSFKTNNTIAFSSHQATHKLSALGATSTRVYKCTRCDRLAPHRWIIERHVRAKHPSESDEIILEIDAPLSSNNGSEPMTATKASSSTALLTSSSSDQDALVATSLKAFSCSACSLQSYHLWVVLRHIRHFHDNDGSNAKIIDNYNNRVIEDTDDLELDAPVSSVSSTTTTTTVTTTSAGAGLTSDRDDDDGESQHDVNNEEMLKRLMDTAMTTRKSHVAATLFEDTSAALTTNNMAVSLAVLLGQLNQQQQLQRQQQQQTEKAPMIKRYKCSLCSHISAWGGNVKKHLKRMHPGDSSGRVIDIGLELAAAAAELQTPSHNDEEPGEMINNKVRTPTPPPVSENNHQQSSDVVVNTKLKDIDNSPSIIPPSQSSMNISQSSRPERLYACSVCPFESTNQSFIHRHVELHGDDGGGFQCSQCFFLSKWRASIRKHMMSMHGSSFASLTNVVEPLTLNKSDDAIVIVKKWILRENNIKHEDDPNNNSTHAIDTSLHYCSSCPFTSDVRSLFEQHLTHHDTLTTKNGVDQTRIYTCTFCSYNIDDEDNLEDHRKLHMIEDDFQLDATANTVENAVV